MIPTKHIQDKIKALRDEVTAMDYSSNTSNLKRTKFEKRQVRSLRSKIQVLNEIIISYGVK